MFFSSFDCAKDVNPLKIKAVKRIVFFIENKVFEVFLKMKPQDSNFLKIN